MRYLTIEQALNDYSVFIDHLKTKRNLKNPVVVFGCSYAGNLAAWMKIKYPHLVKVIKQLKLVFFNCYEISLISRAQLQAVHQLG